MPVDPFEPCNQNLDITGSSIPNSQVAQSGRDVTQNQYTIHSNGGIVTPKIDTIFNVSTSFENIKEVIANTSNGYRNMLPEGRHAHCNIVKSDITYLKKIERIEKERLELERLDSARRADVEERLIRLQNQEIKLRNERLAWEKLVVDENFRLIKESQATALEEKRRDLQLKTDIHYLPLQASREEIIEILSQESGKLVIITSPPEILDVPFFQSLKATIPYKLQDAIAKYYYSESSSFPISCKNIFKSSIEECHASIVSRFLLPIPTIIFQTQVAHQEIYIGITVTCPVSTVPKPQSSDKGYAGKTYRIPLRSWNWMSLKKELTLHEQDSDAINQKILDLISAIHTAVALCFADIYCLNLNPYHSPKLFKFIEESKFPHALVSWLEPFETSVLEAHKKIQEELEKIREVETAQESQGYSISDTDSSNFGCGSLIACGFGMMVLLSMCSQLAPNVNTIDGGAQRSIERKQYRYQEIRVNGNDSHAVNLRNAPNRNSKVVGELRNGTRVIPGKASSDGKWRQVTTESGMTGWVLDKFIQ